MGIFSHFSAARKLLQQGNLEEALAEVDRVVSIFGPSVEALELQVEIREAIVARNRSPEEEANIWFERGSQFCFANDFENAIASFNKAIEFKPDCHEAWHGRGSSLDDLGRYEEAIASYNKAIEFKPDYHEVWSNRGVSLKNLGRYEEAIAFYDKAIAFKPDYHPAWYNRGLSAFSARGKSQLNAFTLRHPTLNDRGYNGQLASLTIGLLYCPEAIAQGFLQREIGDTHWKYARTDANPRPYWHKSLTAYNASLQSLTATDYPEARLETLQAAIPVLIALQEIPTARQYQTHGIQLFNQLRAKTQNKQTFDTKFAKFSHTEIDLLIGEHNPVKALEQAEFYKNRALTWILDEWQETTLSPSYEAIRSLLTPSTAILYWHLSENALTTFILIPSNDYPIVLPVDRYQKSIHLTNLLTDYKREYTSYRNLPKDTAPAQRQQHPWRHQLPQWLDRLTKILDINAIVTHLNDIQNLILLPHRDLHLLHLHTLLSPYTCTYLPSLQTALTQPKTPPTPPTLLAIDDHTDTLKYSRLESAIVRSLLPCKTHLIPDQASHTNAIAALSQSHSLLHFSGHGAYDTIRPQNSAIALAEENLTAKAIATLDLSAYQLITLAACETGITGKDTTTEYIGLTSAFLKANAQSILSTLWQVDELSSTWLIVRFYQAYLQGNSPAQALAIAQTWLKTLTYKDLTTWLTQLLQTHPDLIEYRDNIEAHLANIREDSSKMDSPTPPYGHPYYWAGYLLTGNPSL